MPDKRTQNAALGFRAHSGWATLVAVAGSQGPPTVVDRRRIELVHSLDDKQPYHAAEGLDIGEARRLIERCTATALALAAESIRQAIAELRERSYRPVASGLLLGSGLALGSLEATLASHARIHAAEGELFRDVLIRASEQLRLPVTGVREKVLWDEAASRLHAPVQILRERIAGMGRFLGPPWRQDEKHAALVGWLALVEGQSP